MNEWDLKAHAASRRRKRLADMRDGLDYSTRWIDPATVYKRSVKHKPKSVEDWEGMED